MCETDNWECDVIIMICRHYVYDLIFLSMIRFEQSFQAFISSLFFRREAAKCVIEKYAEFMDSDDFYNLFCMQQNQEYGIPCEVISSK